MPGGRHARLLLLVAGSAAGTAAYLAAGGAPALATALDALQTHRAALILAFTAWALVANCLVLPAGSVSLIAGGAMLGTVLPAAIWYVAQLATAPVIYRIGAAERDQAAALIARYLGPAGQSLRAGAAAEGLSATILLRLTPVLPSAVATLIAASLGIGLRPYLAGSALAGWVRPVYFASLGTALGSLARVGEAKQALSITAAWPLLLACAVAALALALRLWLRRRTLRAAAGATGG